MRFRLSIAFAIAAALGLVPSLASAQVYRCEVVHDKTRINGGQISTTSTAFTSVPGTAIAVAQASNDCLLVEFSAQINAGAAVELRLTRDGLPVGFPALANISTTDASDYRVVRFLVQPDAGNIGTHTYGIDYRSEDGARVEMSRTMITVFYPD